MKVVCETHEIRAARADEATLLSELALRSKAYWGYSPEFMEACRNELSFTAEQLVSHHMRFFVMESSRSIVGFYALACQGGNKMELLALFVEPAFIGKGFGRLLIEHAKSVAFSTGARQLTIQGDPNAERFYVAAGGVLTGRTESGSIPGRSLPTFSLNLSNNNSVE